MKRVLQCLGALLWGAGAGLVTYLLVTGQGLGIVFSLVVVALGVWGLQLTRMR